MRIKAPFGEDRLLVSDPLALRHIIHCSGYTYRKQAERIELSRMISGRGLLWADGDVHKRQKRVMRPAFSPAQSKAYLPIFLSIAGQLSNKWRELVSREEGDGTAQIDVNQWLSRATMDVIGEAAFDYQFQLLHDDSAPLVKSYFNMLCDALGSPSKLGIFVQSISQYLPTRLLNFLSDNVPAQRLERLRQNARDVNKVSQGLIEEKYEALKAGKGRRDVMSLLVRANESHTASARLNEEEMLAQMRTMMFAGHETTATTLSWCLYELARDPMRTQRDLRAEIRGVEMRLAAQGRSEFESGDYEKMPLLAAFIKEILRFHTTVLHIYRQPIKDDVLPLSKPVTTTSGKVLHALPIPQGQKLMLSLALYHRNPDIFGKDVHSFRPGRWPDGSIDESVNSGGAFGNQLLAFSGGVRSCIGWRFAMLELQAILVELVSTFEFEIPAGVKITRKQVIVMVPLVEGKESEGAQMPMMVKLADKSPG